MLFKKGISIKSVLSSSGAGRSLIPAFQQLVDLTVQSWLHFHMTMFADYNPEIEIGEQYKSKSDPKDAAIRGDKASNKRWSAGMYHLLAILCQEYDGKLCLAYGRGPEYAMALHGEDHIMDPSEALVCDQKCTKKHAAKYPYVELTTSKAKHIKMSDRTANTGTIIRIVYEDNTGVVRGTTYMGIMEHITASQASSTASARYQNLMYTHHKRCLDVVHNNQCYDKTVFIRPSSYSGMFTDAHGYDLFPDPFIPCHNYDQLLMRSIKANLVHAKCYRFPDETCKAYFPTIIELLQHKMKALLRIRLYIMLCQIIFLTHDTRKIIVILAYP